ncbi:integrator complex subunit 3 [Impatiens glandulifera]|uniref:integrator complex subunit 3 n=1 Tax=Impatiens glandulifera TaxID=253017 RepID=UPI001FB15A07|nr:integrator complex subunit 3 [Impatiens glandulifera]
MASKLIHATKFEAANPLEVSLIEAFQSVEHQLRPPFPLKVASSTSDYLDFNRAILYGILCEPHSAHIHMKHLYGKVTDGYNFFTTTIINLVNDLYPRLLQSVKLQLLWITNEMIHVSSIGIDGLPVALMRQIIGGDLTEGNIWLCFELLKLLMNKWDCLLDENHFILTSALYTFLRLLADHYRYNDPNLSVLKKMEIDFCVRMLNEQFGLCITIGRDLIRLLQDLVHIPEFQLIWKSLILNPSNFKVDTFSDISQIYMKRTSSRYHLLRIPPEMETNLRFLLTHVNLGSQNRYQAWFMRKFLSNPNRDSLVTDIIRFVCCGHHPTVEIIRSDILPRWAIIGWLLKSCTKKYHVEASAKLALFYDWLFFDERFDNIMNIEPAVLLMVNSIPQYIDMTNSLLEFLLLVVDNYDVERSGLIRERVTMVFNMLVAKGVIRSIDVFVRCDGLSPNLKESFLKLLMRRKPQSVDNQGISMPDLHLQVSPQRS